MQTSPIAVTEGCLQSTALIEDRATTELRGQREQLLLGNQVREETLRKELASSNEELQRIRTGSELERAKTDRELLQKRIAIEKARIEIEEINARVALESVRLQGAMQKELAALRAEKERAELTAQLAEAEFTRKNHTYKLNELGWNARLVELRAKVAEREKEVEAEAYVEQRPVYLKDPVQANGDLVISDRRVALNGLITMETADLVCARIDFYNNKSKEFPIFIVIDDSPGGSVMAGCKILKSMQSSAAPVHVVVKSFAASMAAAICTLAPRSFAYPNAIILHHQISNGWQGNLTTQRERVKILEEWWQRLATPIAAKMGLSVEEFAKAMYSHNSAGDWQEFADNAVKLKWVDTVIGRCQETALIKIPDDSRSMPSEMASARMIVTAAGAGADAKMSTGAALPRLNPLDCYYLYNPDGHFRTE
ncbi:MAG TPA: ATP-dependent Clp protease proteolytic subunit [Chthoniobacteraceae bacterium]|nr:ATP-dependent Clp protease proteolytic subunit [Chthoniobacteraceae bacterium]